MSRFFALHVLRTWSFTLLIDFPNVLARLRTTKYEDWGRFWINYGGSIADPMYRMSITTPPRSVCYSQTEQRTSLRFRVASLPSSSRSGVRCHGRVDV